MPGTYSQILLHIVFSTKHRTPWITPDIADRLYPYLGGVVRAENATLYAVGGMPDHMHLYLRALNRRLRLQPPPNRQSPLLPLDPSILPHPRGIRLAGRLQRLFRQQVSGRRGEKLHRWTGRASSHRGLHIQTPALLRLHAIEFDERYVFD